MSRVCHAFGISKWARLGTTAWLTRAELKRSFGLLSMIGFSFSVVTSSVSTSVANLCTNL